MHAVESHPDTPQTTLTSEAVLASASALLPWAISLVFHLGVLLVLMFFTFLVVQVRPPEDKLPVAEIRWSADPGAKILQKDSATQDILKKMEKSDSSKPAPDVLANAAASRPNSTPTITVPGDKGGPNGGGPSGKGIDWGGDGGRFFGTPGGNASKVVYVVDRSGSMFSSFPYVQAELIRSIRDLRYDADDAGGRARQSFQVIFFADGPIEEMALDGRAELHTARATNKRDAVRWIDGRVAGNKASSQTRPESAIERAFKVAGGPPEVIYLLTDGLFATQTRDLIARLNPERKVRVNTIMVRDRTPEAERLLQQIARENGGEYRFVSASELGTRY